jgi:hypothetical protein
VAWITPEGNRQPHGTPPQQPAACTPAFRAGPAASPARRRARVRAGGAVDAGVLRIALLGSLATDKPVPKDADVLVTIDPAMNLAPLARLGRRLQGTAQTINLAADIFLADAAGRYLGRICHYRECWRRMACRALNCGLRQHLNDDLQTVTLSPALVAAPPIELWPHIVARCAVPADTQALLVAKLEDEPRKT